MIGEIQLRGRADEVLCSASPSRNADETFLSGRD